MTKKGKRKMTFSEYQEKAATTAIYLNKVKAQYPDLSPELIKILGISYASLGIGESGEVQGKVKKIIRDAGGNITDEVKKEIGKECGDILWYISAMCGELGISLDDVAQQNIDKLFSRKDRGVLEGNGDNR